MTLKWFSLWLAMLKFIKLWIMWKNGSGTNSSHQIRWDFHYKVNWYGLFLQLRCLSTTISKTHEWDPILNAPKLSWGDPICYKLMILVLASFLLPVLKTNEFWVSKLDLEHVELCKRKRLCDCEARESQRTILTCI